MWYFTWILGIGLALAFGIINVMWLEASYQVGHLDEDDIYNRFGWRERGSDGGCDITQPSTRARSRFRWRRRGCRGSRSDWLLIDDLRLERPEDAQELALF